MSDHGDIKNKFVNAVMGGDGAAMAEVHEEMRQRVKALGQSAKAMVENDKA